MKKHQKNVKLNREKISILSGGGLNNMTFRDTQRRAIIMGMPFQDVVNSDFHKLNTFIMRSENKPNTALIDEYDKWVDDQLAERGYDKDSPMRSYRLRLGFIKEEDIATGKVKTKRIKGLEKPKRPKREKDAHGLWTGTKKSYTFELAGKGFSVDRIIKRVTKKFPDANPKSINQWYKKYHKNQKANGQK